MRAREVIGDQIETIMLDIGCVWGGNDSAWFMNALEKAGFAIVPIEPSEKDRDLAIECISNMDWQSSPENIVSALADNFSFFARPHMLKAASEEN
jgi:hypothetical protein